GSASFSTSSVSSLLLSTKRAILVFGLADGSQVLLGSLPVGIQYSRAHFEQAVVGGRIGLGITRQRTRGS
ncbi:hypothetical protein Tco_1188201, partial [Tanacetum coccineum]